MRHYEAIYIAHPNLEQDDLSKLIDETKAVLKKRGGELLYEEVLGKKRLAYPIQKQRFGTYILLQFQGDGSGNARMNQDLELNDNILAHMIVRIERDEIREARVEAPEEAAVVIDAEEPDAEVDEESVKAEDEEVDMLESDDEKEEPSEEESPPLSEEDLEPEVKE
ncbi:MAG: 30S ribosomal protein S6 [Fidelibacterota bacterium]|nr:MAG: 30S ribosomal protein S6 [Candidatus Neomarinimicrobiota bacterium]